MTNAPITYDLSLLRQSANKWKHSAALRAMYGDMFQAIRQRLAPGKTLELGSGIGTAREFIPDLVTSDIVPTEFVERGVSAYDIPVEGWSNIIALDVLHHLQRPLQFFQSASRALRPGGRIVLLEPAGTPWGRTFYRLVHPEPCRPDIIGGDYEFTAEPDGSFANMGMGYAMFLQHAPEVARRLAEMDLAVVEVRFRDLVAYPCSGGFSKPALLPAPLLRATLAAERVLPQPLMRLLALRMLIVLERRIA
jgi:SAM-dependent methyltransferase